MQTKGKPAPPPVFFVLLFSDKLMVAFVFFRAVVYRIDLFFLFLFSFFRQVMVAF